MGSSRDKFIAVNVFSRRATSKPKEEWERHKPTLNRLYITENKTCDEVITTMASEYQFPVHKSQLTRKFKYWGWCKRKKYHRRDGDKPGKSTGPAVTNTRPASSGLRLGCCQQLAPSRTQLSPCPEDSKVSSPLPGFDRTAGLPVKVMGPPRPSSKPLPAVSEEPPSSADADATIHERTSKSLTTPPEAQSIYSVSHASSCPRYTDDYETSTVTDNPLPSFSWADDQDLADFDFGSPLPFMGPIGFQNHDISDIGASFGPSSPQKTQMPSPLSKVQEQFEAEKRNSSASPMEGFLEGQQLADRLLAPPTEPMEQIPNCFDELISWSSIER